MTEHPIPFDVLKRRLLAARSKMFESKARSKSALSEFRKSQDEYWSLREHIDQLGYESYRIIADSESTAQEASTACHE